MKVRKSKMKKFTVAERKAIRKNNGELPIDIILELAAKNRDLYLSGLDKK